ncbi:MAG TPA: recombinase family protein [Bradyrhizobium sp.]|jgi:DNA invertase Pin-like site-specific DNA recombinase|nr:recombinase family protein [Bradyrhizobium sp.]
MVPPPDYSESLDIRSTSKQDYDLQVEALKAAGCERIFSEKRSGKSTDGRREFSKLMRALVPGDVVVVTRLDRLARSSRDLLNIVHDLEQAGCGFVSLAEVWCDTTTPSGKLLITVLGGIAEFERSLIMARTEAGIAKAREQGKRFGRPSALDAGQRRKIAERYAAGATMAQLAADYEVGEATIFRALQGPFDQAA